MLFLRVVGKFLQHCMECRHGLAMRILSVCPSVRPSVTRTNCDKTVETGIPRSWKVLDFFGYIFQVLESPGNLSARSWKVLEFSRL